MEFFNSLFRRDPPKPAANHTRPHAQTMRTPDEAAAVPVAAPIAAVGPVVAAAGPQSMSMEESPALIATKSAVAETEMTPANSSSSVPLSSALAASAGSASTAALSSPAPSAESASPTSSSFSPSTEASNSSSSSSARSSSGGSDSVTSDPWLRLLRLRECFVYRLPPRVGLTPYQAEAWGLDKPLATVELHVMAREEVLLLRLVESLASSQPGALFAQSVELNCAGGIGEGSSTGATPLEAFLEPVRDSSRYFAIRVRDARSGATSAIGIGFRERMSAFDLNAACQDRMRTVRRHMADPSERIGGSGSGSGAVDEVGEVARAEARLASNHKDYSIKQGERIKIALKTVRAAPASSTQQSGPPGGPSVVQSRKKKQAGGGPVVVGGDGGFRLAPPPPPPSTDQASLPADTDDQPQDTSSEHAVAAPTNLSPNLAATAPANGELDQDRLDLHRHPASAEGADHAAEGQQQQPKQRAEGEPVSAQPDEDDADEFTDFASAQ